MSKEKSLNSLVLMDKQGLARQMANLTGLAKTGECDVCHYEFPLSELSPYDDGQLCENCLKEAEEKPESLCLFCCRLIPETSDFCNKFCEFAYYQEKSRKED